MRTEISEFSYGYAVVHELDMKFGFSAPPRFPSLRAEGSTGGGYDVQLDRPGAIMFLQFKVAEQMKKRSAIEIKNHHLDLRANGLTLPFFRMHLHRKNLSDQHKMLCELNQANPHVYYLAPKFFNIKDFTTAYHASTILKNSIAFSPMVIQPLIDNKAHHIAYPSSGGGGWLCSEPIPVEAQPTMDRIIETAIATISDSQEAFATTVKHELGHLLQVLEGNGVDPRWTTPKPMEAEAKFRWRMERIDFIARTYFGVYPLMVQPNQKRQS